MAPSYPYTNPNEDPSWKHNKDPDNEPIITHGKAMCTDILFRVRQNKTGFGLVFHLPFLLNG